MRVIEIDALRDRVRCVPTSDEDRPARETESRRCACCGAVMPADVGAWIVTVSESISAPVVLVLCSRECEKQLEAGHV